MRIILIVPPFEGDTQTLLRSLTGVNIVTLQVVSIKDLQEARLYCLCTNVNVTKCAKNNLAHHRRKKICFLSKRKMYTLSIKSEKRQMNLSWN